MNNLKDIHNNFPSDDCPHKIVLSGFQWTIWRIYTTLRNAFAHCSRLFYQDFNEQFEGYTQPRSGSTRLDNYCFIRISMNNLKDIHNTIHAIAHPTRIVLSGFQWTIWRIYTTCALTSAQVLRLFYQDFNEQFEGYTQPRPIGGALLSYCFIRISMNNLKDIHNHAPLLAWLHKIVLSGFQWTIWRIYTTEE